MKFKKRYIPLLLLPLMYGCSRLNILTFRANNEEQKQQLNAYGQEPNFEAYEIGDQLMHYTRVGHDTFPLVLLVHGSPGSSSAFLDYLGDKELTKAAQVIAIDRPGFGYSKFGKAERSLKKQALALKPILEKYQDRKTILAGHSFGGPVIIRAAIDFPDLVDGLVIVAGSVSPDLEPREWWRKPLDWWIIRWLVPPALRVCNQEILPLYKELEIMLPDWDKVTCPVTIIHGKIDNLVPVDNADFAKAQLINSPQVKMQIIEQGDHFILWSRKGEVIRAILELL